MPAGTGAILDARTLAGSHRRLAELLTPDLTILDVGCATGAITRGIALAVAPTGRALGIDVDADLIARARSAHRDAPCLAFAVADVYDLPARETFDVVTGARVLQWLADPAAALAGMATAAKRGGRVVVLDYNHGKVAWRPEPPASMRSFYAAFLAWRAEAGMDNAIADHLPALFTGCGLARIAVTAQHETSRRGEPDFEMRAGIWAEVAATRGRQMVTDGAITEAERAAAEAEYREWVREGCESHTQYLLAVDGMRR